MARTCSICNGGPERRGVVDLALVEGRPTRAIAVQVGTSKDAVRRHRQHVERLAERVEARERINLDAIVTRVEGIAAKAEALLSRAEDANDLRACTGLLRETRAALEVLGRWGVIDRPTEAESPPPASLVVVAAILRELGMTGP